MNIHSLFLTAFLSLPVLTVQAAQNVEILRGTTVDVLGMASTDRLRTATIFREVHLRIPFPHGGGLNGELLLTQDTASHRFWWNLRNDGGQRLRLDSAEWFASHSATYLTIDKMVVFWSSFPGRLIVVERSGLVADSMDEALQKTVDEIGRRVEGIEKGAPGYGLGGTEVQMAPRVPVSFWIGMSDPVAQVPGRTKVVTALREGTNWKLVLRDQWDQEVILDDSYNFLSTRRLDSGKQDNQ